MKKHAPGAITVSTKGCGKATRKLLLQDGTAIWLEFSGLAFDENAKAKIDAMVRLIAAAPELLAACEAIEADLFCIVSAGKKSPHDDCWACQHAEQLRAALAKARGES